MAVLLLIRRWIVRARRRIGKLGVRLRSILRIRARRVCVRPRLRRRLRHRRYRRLLFWLLWLLHWTSLGQWRGQQDDQQSGN